MAKTLQQAQKEREEYARIGGSAFPEIVGGDQRGMTLRDYFATAALQGMCGGTPGSHLVPPNTAKLAYEYADAMIAEKEQAMTHWRDPEFKYHNANSHATSAAFAERMKERVRVAEEARKQAAATGSYIMGGNRIVNVRHLKESKQ